MELVQFSAQSVRNAPGCNLRALFPRLFAQVRSSLFGVCIGYVFLLLTFPVQARAYTDPGSGILLWQTIMATFVGFLFYFRRFVRWVSRMRDRKD